MNILMTLPEIRVSIDLSIDLSVSDKNRRGYSPIDDRARYWANFLGGDKVWEDELRKFSEGKKKEEYCRD